MNDDISVVDGPLARLVALPKSECMMWSHTNIKDVTK